MPPKKPPDSIDGSSNHTTVKCKLSAVIPDGNSDFVGILNDRVDRLGKNLVEGIFLFNIYVLYLLRENICATINETTISRCVRHLLIGCRRSSADCNPDEDTRIKLVKDNFFKFDASNRPEFDCSNEDAYMRPLDYATEVYLVNLKLHIQRNFLKFQKRYIFCKLSQFNMNKTEQKFVLYCITRRINGDHGYEYSTEHFKKGSKENHRDRFNRISLQFQLDGFIEQEHMLLFNLTSKYCEMEFVKFPQYDATVNPSFKHNKKTERKLSAVISKEIPVEKYKKYTNETWIKLGADPKKIEDGITYMMKKERMSMITTSGYKDELPSGSVTNENIYYYLKYFKHMLDEIKRLDVKNKTKRFTLLPQLSAKSRYFTFDRRSLAPLYNKMKSTGKNKVPGYKFEAEFANYFPKMFTIKEKFRNRVKKFPLIKTIATDGYTIAIHFERDKITPANGGIQNNEEEGQEKKPLLDFESEYNKESKKRNRQMIYEASELETTEEYLKRFNIGGVDPGNQVMFDITMESGLHFTIHKNYYNDLAHITRNTNIKNKKIKKQGLDKIYSSLAENGNTKTTSVEEYTGYVKNVRQHWNVLWNFCNKPLMKSLDFDTDINKTKAVAKIGKEIVEKCRDEKNLVKKYEKYTDKNKFKKSDGKQILLCMGKGNGNTTVSNTKGTSAHGPVKRIINELSKRCVVVLTPEHCTSKNCCICDKELVDVDVFTVPKEYDEHTLNTIKEGREEIRNDKRHIWKKKIEGTKKAEMEIWIRELNDDIKEMELDGVHYYGSSYRLRRCVTKHPTLNRCKLWERNHNASINMMKKMQKTITMVSGKEIYTHLPSCEPYEKDSYVEHENAELLNVSPKIRHKNKPKNSTKK